MTALVLLALYALAIYGLSTRLVHINKEVRTMRPPLSMEEALRELATPPQDPEHWEAVVPSAPEDMAGFVTVKDAPWVLPDDGVVRVSTILWVGPTMVGGAYVDTMIQLLLCLEEQAGQEITRLQQEYPDHATP